MQHEEHPEVQQENLEVNEAGGHEDQEGNAILPVINPYGSNMELLEQIWAQVPMDVVHAEYDTPMGVERSSRNRKFGGDKALQSTGDKDAMNRGKGVMLTDEDEDHIILEMEERWDSEFRMGPVDPCMMRDPWGVEKTPMDSAREKERSG
ncbi:hypothetical protein F2Q69_00053398 [Brassica cretica]|uniref:Uncharacterized protein n=1 Tax=Brassica cretica TaxID=69181 RepID=A0A8S9N4I8_BRACR|nr:hypothetical protein F2Q69_00053398 [Brassica cretica]